MTNPQNQPPSVNVVTAEPPPDWSNFEGLKRNIDWKPDDQDLIYTAINFRDDEWGDADEDAGQQIVERLLVAWRSAVATEQLTFEISARLLKERDAEREEVGRLQDEIDDAKNVPWPEWADKVVKIAREYSGYDGYDDATDGVDIVGEVEEALAELHSEGERLRAKLAAAQIEATAPAQNAVTAGQGVEVKPLEWEAFNGCDEQFSDTVVGRYEVGQVGKFIIATVRGIKAGQWEDEVFAHCSSVDKAKAAAQADYERRILSALATPTPKEESK